MTTGVVCPPLILQFTLNNGQLAANGSILTQVGGVNAATYQDSGLTTPLPNPIPLNSRGEVSNAAGASCQLFLTPNTVYVFTLYDANGNQIWQAPYVNGVQLALTQAGIGLIYRPTLSWETGVVNNFWDYGDLRRFGCDITGATDNSANITNAITSATAAGGNGFIYHPGGTISHSLQITIPNGLTILGWSRAECIFQFTGTPSGSPASTRSAWRYQGVAPWSGYANVSIRHVKFVYVNTVNFAAVVELNGWGWAYWDIEDVWIRGNCSFGLILDGVEICAVHSCLIENSNATVCYNVWIVNGADRGFSQGTGFSNRIALRDCQISGPTNSYGLADDGGNSHVIESNNFNQNSIQVYVAGVQNLSLRGNSFETLNGTGPANVYFTSVAANSGAAVGPVHGFKVDANGFYGNISSGSLLVFTGSNLPISAITKAFPCVITCSTVSSTNPFIVGEQIYVSGIVGMTQINTLALWVTAIGGASGAWTATVVLDSTGFSNYVSGGQAAYYHRGGVIESNSFGGRAGRGGAIDVSFLANSRAGQNVDESVSSGFSHYLNVHTDPQGNTLFPPQNGFIGTIGIIGPTYGDTRFRNVYDTAIQEVYTSIVYSASMSFDLGTANCFEINATNGTAFTINSPSNANQGNRYTVRVKNTSGGALGAVTWGPSFKLAAWTSPATGNSRSITFDVDGAGLSVEVSRTPADVPN